MKNIFGALKKQNNQIKSLLIDFLIKLLTSQTGALLRADIHQYMNYELVNSKSSIDRSTFVHFCNEISEHISNRYFQEIFLDSFVTLMEDKQINVQISVLRSIKNIRRKIDDVLLINRIESFINTQRMDASKKTFLREVKQFNNEFRLHNKLLMTFLVANI